MHSPKYSNWSKDSELYRLCWGMSSAPTERESYLVYLSIRRSIAVSKWRWQSQMLGLSQRNNFHIQKGFLHNWYLLTTGSVKPHGTSTIVTRALVRDRVHGAGGVFKSTKQWYTACSSHGIHGNSWTEQFYLRGIEAAWVRPSEIKLCKWIL